MASRSDVTCYRVYDADMPEYAFAIDIYRTIDPDQTWLYVQEYAAPAEIELESVRRRRNEALSVMPEVTGVPQERIHVRTRRRNKRGEQYRKVDEQANSTMSLKGSRFRVNFDDYLDTGLFLDHRMTRAGCARQPVASGSSICSPTRERQLCTLRRAALRQPQLLTCPARTWIGHSATWQSTACWTTKRLAANTSSCRRIVANGSRRVRQTGSATT